MVYPKWSEVSEKVQEHQTTRKEYLQTEYPWLSNDLYKLYNSRSEEYNVHLTLALAFIKHESNGKIVRSRKNRNGTRDYGRFQVNTRHKEDNPRELLKDELNSYYGFYYISRCLKHSNYNLPEAIRKYNQGINGTRSRYKNWKYVERILTTYINTRDKTLNI